MKLKITRAPTALPTVRADGGAIIESEHEVLLRFYFDSPPLPGQEGDWTDGTPEEEKVVVRELVASVSLSPAAARRLHRLLGRLTHVGG